MRQAEDWFNDGLGINYGQFISVQRLGIPTVRIECEFRAPSKIGEVLRMRLGVKKIGTSSMTLVVSANAGNEIRVEAQRVIVFLSLETRRVVAIPHDLRALMGRFSVEA